MQMYDSDIPKILKDYLNYNANLNKSKATITEYRYDLTNFLKYIKLLKLNDRKLTIDDISSIKDILVLPPLLYLLYYYIGKLVKAQVLF